MRYTIVNEESERFGQTGMLVGSDEVARALNIHSIMFDDGVIERFLSYEISAVRE